MTRTYLVETYWPGVTEAAYTDRAARADAAAGELRATGVDIEFLGSTLIPGDEIAFWRFASASRAGVEEASSRAGLAHDRVLESLELSAPGAKHTMTAGRTASGGETGPRPREDRGRSRP